MGHKRSRQAPAARPKAREEPTRCSSSQEHGCKGLLFYSIRLGDKGKGADLAAECPLQTRAMGHRRCRRIPTSVGRVRHSVPTPLLPTRAGFMADLEQTEATIKACPPPPPRVPRGPVS